MKCFLPPHALKPLVLVLAQCLCTAATAQTQIVRDGTVGTGPLTALTATGVHTRNGTTYNKFSIPEAIGRRAGQNVFHSFSTFNIGTGAAAVYSLDAATRNVVSRVTGGSASTINGLLTIDPAAAGGTPTFFFVNPAGITFGAGAALDVPGAFHASTAHVLKFPDGVLYADPARNSTFSTADPVAFGFLGPAAGSIALRDGALIATNNAPVSVTAANIEIDAALLVSRQAGGIRVAATGSSTVDVPLAGSLPSLSGDLTIVREGRIAQVASEAGVTGGDVQVSAGNVLIDGTGGAPRFTGIFNNGDVAANAGNVMVNVSGDLVMVEGGAITSRTSGTGNSGFVEVNATNILMQAAGAAYSAILAETRPGSTGHAGTVNVNATDGIKILGAGVISSTTFGAGNAGAVEVNASNVMIEGSNGASFAGVLNQAVRGATGNAGSVRVTASGDITLRNGAMFSSTTYGPGSAGRIEVSASKVVLEGGATSFSMIASDAAAGSTGQAGTVTVGALRDVVLSGAAVISSTTYGAGAGGHVGISAGGDIALLGGASISSSTIGTGRAGSIDVGASNILLEGGDGNYTRIVSESGGNGDAGSVHVHASGNLVVRDAKISSGTSWTGNAGSVEVNASNVLIEGSVGNFYVGVLSEAGPGSGGNAGTVKVTASNGLTLRGAASVSSSTEGAGNAGSVQLTAANVLIDGSGVQFHEGVSSGARFGSTGNAGSVTVTAANDITLSGGGVITSTTSGPGAGGNVTLSAGGQVAMRAGSSISSDTYGTGNAGSVDVSASSILIEGAADSYTRLVSETFGSGAAGSVKLRATGDVVVRNALVSSSTFGDGHAGSVEVNASNVVIEATEGDLYVGLLSESRGGAGNAGTVTVTASSDITLSGGGFISTTTSGPGAGGNVTLSAFGHIAVSGGSSISSSSHSTGNAGSVDVSASSILVEGGGSRFTQVASETVGAGAAGTVKLRATGDVVVRDALVSSSTLGAGHAGSVEVNASNVVLEATQDSFYVGLASESGSGSGNAGAVTVSASNNLTVRGAASISSSTFGGGNAGSVQLAARNVLIDGSGGRFYEGVSSRAWLNSTGNAGSVTVTATNDITLSGGVISSTTDGPGAGGRVVVSAGRDIVLFGGAVISSSSFGPGNAGSVEVDARNVLLDGGGNFASVSSEAEGDGPGNAGSVIVRASNQLSLRNGGYISTRSSGSGNAGAVLVTAANVEIEQTEQAGAGIVSDVSYFSAGNAGSITVTASNDISLRGGVVGSRNFGDGIGGTVHVTAGGRISLSDGGRISTGTFTGGTGGAVEVRASEILIDGGETEPAAFTGIDSDASFSSTGPAGSIRVVAGKGIVLRGNAVMTSSTHGLGPAGSLEVEAPTILLEGGFQVSPRVVSQAGIGIPELDTTGNAGTVTVRATDDLTLRNGSVISSRTHGTGNAGSVEVRAGHILLESASTIDSEALASSTGHAGSVKVTASGNVTMLGGALISSSTSGPGQAGSVEVNAAGVLLEGAVGQYTRITSETAGSGNAGTVKVSASNDVVVRSAKITSGTTASGHAGSVEVTAANVLVDSLLDAFTGILSESGGFADGNAGNVKVTARNELTLTNGGSISSSANNGGAPGAVEVTASSITISGVLDSYEGGVLSQAGFSSVGGAGSVAVTASDNIVMRSGGVISSSTFGATPGGSVKVTAGRDLVMREGSTISSETFGSGGAGSIEVQARNMLVGDGVPNAPTGIGSNAGFDSTGHAGSVRLGATGDIVISGASVSSHSFGSGNAGSVELAASTILVDGGRVESESLFGGGNAGSVTLRALGDLTLRNGVVSTLAGYSSQASAGIVQLHARNVLIDEGSSVTSDSEFAKDAGTVQVTASNDITIRNEGSISSMTVGGGAGGSVRVSAGGMLALAEGGRITTGTTSGGGRGGSIEATTAGIIVESHGGSRSGFDAGTEGSGAAGDIRLVATGDVVLRGDAVISSSTSAAGSGGTVDVQAGSVNIDGGRIEAAASSSSGGQAGSINLVATGLVSLSNGLGISAQNDAVVANPTQVRPTSIRISAPDIRLTDASISSASTGNVASSSIDISFTGSMRLDPSSISTTAKDGNGGSIAIRGGSLLDLTDSFISTSVTGLLGNGGDILVQADTLLLRTGFIQANTAAANATGGNVLIDVRNVVPSGSSLIVGGTGAYGFQPFVFGFNVIQAAAPTGVSGAVNITSPALDLGGALAGLNVRQVDPVGLAGSPCRSNAGSSFAVAGRGSLPVSARGLLAPSAPDVAPPAPAASKTVRSVVLRQGCNLAAAAPPEAVVR